MPRGDGSLVSGHELSRRERLWFGAAAVPFLLSIGLLGFALSHRALIGFAVGWPVLQVIGYAGAYWSAGGDITHPLVKNQAVLHWIVLVLLLVLIWRV